MKPKILNHVFLTLLFIVTVAIHVEAQAPATRSTIVGIGRATCTGGTNGVQNFKYDGASNILSQIGGICQPSLGAPGFSISRAVIDYNPKDQMVYYFRRILVSAGPPAVYNTVVWRWPAGTCPTGNLAPLSTFTNEYLTVAFDAAGNGWMIKLSPTAPHTLTMRKVDFTTSTFGPAVNIDIPPGVNIYTSNGDYMITPGGNMFFAYDNKLLTVNYQTYNGVSPQTATYIDTISLPIAGQSLIGLAYGDGEFVGSFIKTAAPVACGYSEVDILTGDRFAITHSGGTFASYDNTSVTSGIGAAKNLVSVTPTATPGRYTVVYDVFVKNYGNYPVSSVQVIDSLQFINGLANVVPGSVSKSFISNPGGLILNAAYNGTTDARLLTPGQTLVNTPAANNNFTIRVTADILNIVPGIIYYNSAVATGIGFNSEAIRDSSANGSNPDLNLNEKPDDAGEDQRTPFVITAASQSALCANLTTILHSQNFNTASNQATMPAGTATQYTGSLVNPLTEERFVITNDPSIHNTAYWSSMADHGGGGRMMVVNADVNNGVIYSTTISGLCGNLRYSFSAWVANISNASQVTFCNAVGGFKYPKLTFRVRDAGTGVVLTNITTGDITSGVWAQHGMRFVLPTGYPNLILEIINEGEGGCGNDLAIDDVQFGLCDPTPTVVANTPSTGCIGSPASFSATLSDPTVISGTIEYQWQESTDNIAFTNIIGAVLSTYTIPSVNASHLKYYRVLIAAAGSIGNPSCRYTSPGFLLTAKSASTTPTSIAKNKLASCPGETVALQVTGGTFGTNASYVWYAGSCGGTPIGTGSTINVSPTVTTTYFVRIEGDCNNTACVSTTVTINCDIDADDDGIPDVTESAGVDPKFDDDFDGIPNWRDANLAGFTDTNSDGVNDNFDWDRDGIPDFLDRDSDNDAIPDAVESGGGDNNGDGRIDGYADTDSDGLSDNVDANLSGHLSSGDGLGLADRDSDGVPNMRDTDSDGDGVPDIREVYGTDSNNNGIIDYTGTFAANDTDGDGLINSVDGDADGNGTIENISGPLLKTAAVLANGRASGYSDKNMDADGIANPYDLDSDGDGINDVIEANFTDANLNGLADGALNTRGWSSTIAALVALAIPNSESVGRENPYDIDSDGDGIPDNVEGLPTNTYLLPSGLDDDVDGIDNSYDNIGSYGGAGISPADKDLDSQPDYLDLDTDNDTLGDIMEGNDFNFNTYPDDNITPTGVDTDGDGLDNRFDADNTSAKGTSQYMGDGGTLSGPASPGGITVVQKYLVSNSDRDWRFTDYVLDVHFVDVKVNSDKNNNVIQWKITSTEAITRYDVERSVDGLRFRQLTKLEGKPGSSTIQNFSTIDTAATEPGVKNIYYRIAATNTRGVKYYSKTVMAGVPVNRLRQSLMVLTNPVSKTLLLGVTVQGTAVMEFQILDAHGRLIDRSTRNLRTGYNTVNWDIPYSLSKGTYFVRGIFNQVAYSAAFVIK